MTDQLILSGAALAEVEAILGQCPDMSQEDLMKAVFIWRAIDSDLTPAQGDDAQWLRLFRQEHNISFSTLNHLGNLVDEAAAIEETVSLAEVRLLETDTTEAALPVASAA